MTSKERFRRIFEKREADRIPIVDNPWIGTLLRWFEEGMPREMDWEDYFGIDKIGAVHCDMSPRYPVKIIEETEEYTIATTGWGVTLKNFKVPDSTPEFLDFKIKDSTIWKEAKQRMKQDISRFDMSKLRKEYPKWQKEGCWLQANFWFGFDVAHSWMSGTETILIAMLEEPEWVYDIFNTYLDLSIQQYELLQKQGYVFDEVFWCDDMGYKSRTFFSMDLYRSLLKPVQKRAVDWIHKNGMYAHLHSCGYIMPFVPELIEIGVDALNPLEVKAGMDPVVLKEKFGDKLTLHGGMNAMNWNNTEVTLDEIRKIVPILKKNGGYIFSSDHSIPNSVSLQNYRAIVDCVKKEGSYDKYS